MSNPELKPTGKLGLEQLVRSVNLNRKVNSEDKEKIYQLVKDDLTKLFEAIEDYANKESQSKSLISKFRNLLNKSKEKKTTVSYETSISISIDTYLGNIEKIHDSKCKDAKGNDEIKACQGEAKAIDDIKKEYMLLLQDVLKEFLLGNYENKGIRNVDLQTTEDYKNKKLIFILSSTTNWGFDKINLENNKLTTLVSTKVKKSEEVKEKLNNFENAIIEFMNYYEIAYLK